jgi:hypothetical protein
VGAFQRVGRGGVLEDLALRWGILAVLLAGCIVSTSRAQTLPVTNALPPPSVKGVPWGSPSPSNGAVVSASLALLDWDDIPEARWYEVCLATNPSPGVSDSRGRFWRSQWPVVGDLKPGNTYYWRVIGGNDYGRTTGGVWRFTVAQHVLPSLPTNPIPEDSAKAVDLNLVLLDWADAERARSYEVSLGTNAMCVGNAEQDVSPISRFPLHQRLQPGRTYYWRVVARNQAGSVTGGVWRFTTKPIPTPSASRR